MIVVYEGSLKIQDEEETLTHGKVAVFELSEEIEEILKFQSLSENTKFILIGGKPIG